MVRSSGPAARELLLFFIACKTIPREERDTELSSGHTLLMELPPDNPGGQVAGMGDN